MALRLVAQRLMASLPHSLAQNCRWQAEPGWAAYRPGSPAVQPCAPEVDRQAQGLVLKLAQSTASQAIERRRPGSRWQQANFAAGHDRQRRAHPLVAAAAARNSLRAQPAVDQGIPAAPDTSRGSRHPDAEPQAAADRQLARAAPNRWCHDLER